jgi:hypothetical protein
VLTLPSWKPHRKAIKNTSQLYSGLERYMIVNITVESIETIFTNDATLELNLSTIYPIKSPPNISPRPKLLIAYIAF